MARTLGNLVDEFKAIYELSDGDLFEPIRHDGVHAMTGFGVGIADEVRVAMTEMTLSYNNPKSLIHAYNHAANLHDLLKTSLYGPEGTINVDKGGLETAHYRTAQARTVPLDTEELRQLYELGHKMNEAIRCLTGKSYRALSAYEISRLDFSKVDFSGEAQAIKAVFEKEKNREVAELTTEALRAEARRKGKNTDAIPDANASWLTLTAAL